MCFSTTASFVTAGVTGAIGLVCIGRTERPQQLPLAVAPIIFAIQQGIEGVLWLSLSGEIDRSVSLPLTALFLLVAEVFWPIYVSFAVLMSEPSRLRRRFMMPCLAAGVCVSAYLFWSMFIGLRSAEIIDGHIVYPSQYEPSVILALGYLAATVLPLMLSSQRTIVVLGGIIFLGLVTACIFYWEAFVSVWCFFAAAASVVILGHFEQSRRAHLHIAPAEPRRV